MADPVAVLAGACASVRPGGPADAVHGTVPAAVATPATVAEASDVLRAAAGLGLAVLPRGTGTKLGWGVPPRGCDLIIDTTALDAVIEHAAGDLVVRVQAGLEMRRLAAHLATAGQQLALDTPDACGAAGMAAAGTVGGVVATGTAGPRRLRYGAPRDLLIGITVVLADGTVASAGGKVVKNVAGYDLGKLFAGSHGTLGLIAEAAFRLHPLPPATSYVTVSCPAAEDAVRMVRAAIDAQLSPAAAEIDRPAPGGPLTVGLLLEGTADAMPERAAAAVAVLGAGARAAALPPDWWGRAVTGGDGTLLRIAFPPAELAAVLRAIDEAAGESGEGAGGLSPAVRGSAGAGVLDAGLAAGAAAGAAAAFVTALRHRLAASPAWGAVAGASVTMLHAPAPVRLAADPWGDVPAFELMRAVKDQFDPGHVMSPGRFAGGI
jgi:glycolate dehydrogenase FAD-binding subunit